MRILVTGAAGFLGSHVAQYLLSAGHDVPGFDQSDGNGASYEMIVGDLLDPDSLGAAAHGADAICHLGAIGDVYLAAEEPQLAAAINAAGSANVGRAALAAEAKAVCASTWEVYGEPVYQPMTDVSAHD